MADPMYRIVDWDEHFENNRSRTVKNARFTLIPNAFDGDRISELIEEGGPECYGAWVAVICLTSRCQPRDGCLRRPGNGSERPHTPTTMARITRMPKKSFEKMIKIALNVGLIEVASPCHDANTMLTPPCQSPDEGTEGTEGTEGNTSVQPVSWTVGGGWSGITDELKSGWREAYPACDIDRQLAAMSSWLAANPSKARKSNWKRFVINWLIRSQDRGGDAKSNPVDGFAQTITNFRQAMAEDDAKKGQP